jgi:hypothetical protein
MSTPFLNDAFVRSVLTRRIAVLESSTRRRPSQKRVKRLNALTQTYHGILATLNMTPETTLEVLSDLSEDKASHSMSTLSTLLKKAAETSASITQNIK